jgi:hypothetical protein
MEYQAKSGRSGNPADGDRISPTLYPMAQKISSLFFSHTGYNPKLEFFNYGDIHCPNRSGRSACH